MTPADLSRLEEHVLGLLGEGGELRLSELRRDFPDVDEADVQRVQTSAEIFHAWLEDLGVPAAASDRRSDASWLEPGERIGGYVVLRRIPGGGMGQVYHAVQESLYPRKVALKVHRLGRNADRELRRARREAEVASRLVHPHLAAVHDMGHDEERGLVYFSMQLVEGCDLREELRETNAIPDRAGVRRIVTRISEVAGALSELHGRGYVHRDVKPENILLRRNAGRDGHTECAVLVDFGLVRAERVLRGEAALVAGTPGYSPPEADLGAGVTPAWDVYSLGVVLYEALSGTHPSRDARGVPLRPSATELESLRVARGVNADLAAIVGRATRADPEARYPDAGELQADLECWLAGDLVSARRPPLHERTWRAARRHPRRAALLALSLPLVIGMVLVAREALEVRRGLADLDRGELARGWENLITAGPLFVRTFAGGRGDLAQDLLHGTQVAPVSRVANAERERGRGAALELAAAYLERDGFEVDGVPLHPELEAFLLRSLDAQRPEERSHALRVIARLFFERPAAGAPSAFHVSPFRERLLAVLEHPETGREDLLHAVSALGGCGASRELEHLVGCAEAAARRRDVETARLAIVSSDHILRRLIPAPSMRASSEVDWPALEERFAALWDELRGPVATPSPVAGLVEAWMDLVTAWGLVHRRTGYRPRLADELLAGTPAAELCFRAALRGPEDTELRELLVATAQRRAGLGTDSFQRAAWAHTLGLAGAYVGSEDLRAAIEAALRDDAELVAAFGLGLREGSADLEHGAATKYLPDEASRLRHLLAVDGASEPLVFDPGAPLPPESTALWRFDPPTRAGWAADLLLGGGARWERPEYDPPHLRLARSGAWFEARMLVTEIPPSAPGGCDLVLTHLAASRPYLPFQGQVWVRVELDGIVLADRARVGHVGRHDLALRIEPQLITPGEHVVRVTAVEASTTYWIHEVRVEPR